MKIDKYIRTIRQQRAAIRFYRKLVAVLLKPLPF
jgi:hypothetical protein